MSLFLSPKSQSSSTSFHSFQILKYDEPTNQWIECSLNINGSSLIIEQKHSQEHLNQLSYYLSQSNFQLKKHISFVINNTQQSNVLEIQFINQPPQPEQTLLMSFTTEAFLNSCYESIINTSETTFNFPFQSGEKEINVSFSEACEINDNNNNNNDDTFNLSPSFSSKCTKSRNNNNNDLSPLQYKAHSHKDNITNLFELSIKQSAKQLKMENITPIKSYMKCIINTQTHSNNNKSTNINQRYLYYDFDDTSINEDNINQNSPSDNSFSALNCLNIFNSNLQSSPQNKISFLAKSIDSYEIFIYDSYLFKKVIKENNLTKIDIGNLYKQITSPHIKIQILTEMIARISKQHLKLILSNKTQINNHNELFNPDEAIITVFNLFLGNNKESIDLYEKTLPGELNDLYQIEIILNIKNRISLHNLFAMMQYHNKVYFNDNYNINFNDETPFISHDIKYISPYLIEKIFNSIVTNPTDILSLTSLKRLPNALSDCSNTLKSYHLNSDEARIDLINSIYSFIPFKKWELCGRVCEYYLSKYNSTLFLNSMIYMVLAEIYNVISSIESSKVFFEKGIEILNWLYPNGNCHLICDAYYSYSLLLMKQNDAFVNENIDEISKIIDKALLLGKEFYEGFNKERYLKIKMNYYLFRCLFWNDNKNADKDVFNGGSLWDNIVRDLEEMFLINKIEGEIYVRMFMELIERDKTKKEAFVKMKHIIIA